ncbi:MAG: YbaN family protein [Planctomycetales bacterium]|nr:YbaN family protein [Planctomycetales bacterium]
MTIAYQNAQTPASKGIPAEVSGLRRPLYWLGAGLFFSLAMLGVVLPGLPTTPFLLLMCYFLIRVSPTLHSRALRWPVIGEPLRVWHDQGGVRVHVKCLAIAMVAIFVGSTLVLSAMAAPAKVAVATAAVYGVYVVVRLPTANGQRANSKTDRACNSNQY